MRTMAQTTINSNIIEKRAVLFRQQFGLGYTEAVQMKSLLMKLNIQTFFWPMSEHFSGMSVHNGDKHRFMLINSNQPLCHQQFTIAHELYHLYVDKVSKPHNCEPCGKKKDTVESEADLFASYVLLPAAAIIQMIPDDELLCEEISLATVIKLEQYFMAPRHVVIERLFGLNLISKQQMGILMESPIVESALELGYNNSLYSKANEGVSLGDYGEKARSLFKAGKISEGHYIELMNTIRR